MSQNRPADRFATAAQPLSAQVVHTHPDAGGSFRNGL